MRSGCVQTVRWMLLLVMVAAVLAGAALSWRAAQQGEGPAFLRALAGQFPPLAGRRIGLISGHLRNDSGAVCPDGLDEAGINESIARLAAASLIHLGAQVDILDEFDKRLIGYRADALLAIHADSCQVDLSGYKIAAPAGRVASARLADCLWQAYGEATGLPTNVDTITDDMRQYYAFHQISAGTPAAIIETGFLKKDRGVLAGHPERAGAGIVSGLTCFLAPDPPDG